MSNIAKINQEREYDPPTLDHVVASGENRRIIDQIRLTLDSTFATASQYPHSLFVGGAGSGKSLYCDIVARELGIPEPVKMIGQTLSIAEDLHGVLVGLGEGGVLILDEIHTLQDWGQTILLRALENREVYLEGGNTPKRKPTAIRLPRFTLLAATTDEYQLIPPLLDRFRLTHRLAPYSNADIETLLRQRASALRWDADAEVFKMIAMRARATPRWAIRLLESVQRTATAVGSSFMSVEHARKTFHLEGLDETGLTILDRSYLAILKDSNGPVRLNFLASRLGAPAQTLIKLVESHLIRLDMIVKTEGGRMLSQRGLEYLRAQESSNTQGDVVCQ